MRTVFWRRWRTYFSAMSKPVGNPGTRISDATGSTPLHGEVSAYARAVGLTRVVVRARLQSGQLHVGDDGLIYPRPEPAARVAPNVVPFKRPPSPEPEFPPSMTWAERRAAFEAMALFLIEGRPDGCSIEDAAHALVGNVRAALGTAMCESVSIEHGRPLPDEGGTP